jgi:hypothetical protein
MHGAAVGRLASAVSAALWGRLRGQDPDLPGVTATTASSIRRWASSTSWTSAIATPAPSVSTTRSLCKGEDEYGRLTPPL